MKRQCPQCGLFISASNFAAHIKLHLAKQNNVKYSCEFCGKSFYAYRNLKEHITLKHSDVEFVCDKCGLKLRDRPSLSKHKNSFRNGIFDCLFCCQSFNTKEAVDKHQVELHEKCSDCCDKRGDFQKLCSKHSQEMGRAKGKPEKLPPPSPLSINVNGTSTPPPGLKHPIRPCPKQTVIGRNRQQTLKSVPGFSPISPPAAAVEETREENDEECSQEPSPDDIQNPNNQFDPPFASRQVSRDLEVVEATKRESAMIELTGSKSDEQSTIQVITSDSSQEEIIPPTCIPATQYPPESPLKRKGSTEKIEQVKRVRFDEETKDDQGVVAVNPSPINYSDFVLRIWRLFKSENSLNGPNLRFLLPIISKTIRSSSQEFFKLVCDSNMEDTVGSFVVGVLLVQQLWQGSLVSAYDLVNSTNNLPSYFMNLILRVVAVRVKKDPQFIQQPSLISTMPAKLKEYLRCVILLPSFIPPSPELVKVENDFMETIRKSLICLASEKEPLETNCSFSNYERLLVWNLLTERILIKLSRREDFNCFEILLQISRESQFETREYFKIGSHPVHLHPSIVQKETAVIGEDAGTFTCKMEQEDVIVKLFYEPRSYNVLDMVDRETIQILMKMGIVDIWDFLLKDLEVTKVLKETEWSHLLNIGIRLKKEMVAIYFPTIAFDKAGKLRRKLLVGLDAPEVLWLFQQDNLVMDELDIYELLKSWAMESAENEESEGLAIVTEEKIRRFQQVFPALRLLRIDLALHSQLKMDGLVGADILDRAARIISIRQMGGQLIESSEFNTRGRAGDR